MTNEQDTLKAPYAGFWIRLVASLIDGTLLTIASWLIELMLVGAYYWIRILTHTQSPDIGIWDSVNSLLLQVINIIIYTILAYPYYVWAQYKYGTTLGKYPLRIYVVQADSQAPLTYKQSLIRFGSYALSYLPFCIGFLMAAFHPEKRALHDLIAGTVSIKKPKKIVIQVTS